MYMTSAMTPSSFFWQGFYLIYFCVKCRFESFKDEGVMVEGWKPSPPNAKSPKKPGMKKVKQHDVVMTVWRKMEK